MKKRTLFILALVLAAAAGLAREKQLTAQAASPSGPYSFMGRGSLVMDSEAIGFYQADIQYLSREIQRLKEECY